MGGLVNGKDLLQGDWAANWLFNGGGTLKCQTREFFSLEPLSYPERTFIKSSSSEGESGTMRVWRGLG